MTAYEPLEPAEVAAPLIHDGDHLVVRREEGRSDWTLVTFNEISMVAAGGRYWAQSFARRNGLRALGFVTKAPNWFPTSATLGSITDIAPVLAEAHPRVLYGHSMGGYAAIKFSAALDAETVIAFCPQHSIEPALTERFTAHAAFYSPLNEGMRITREDMGGRIFLFYDPCCETDRFHVSRIPSFDGLTLIPLRHTGHDTIRCFASSRIALALIGACRAADMAGLRRLAATQRRRFPGRARAVALALSRRRPHWALRILSGNSSVWSTADIATVYAHAGEGYFKLGNRPLAEHCIMAATELDPREAKHALLRSAVLYHTRRSDEALVWVRRALSLAPDNIYAQRHLADVERRLAETA